MAYWDSAAGTRGESHASTTRPGVKTLDGSTYENETRGGVQLEMIFFFKFVEVPPARHALLAKPESSWKPRLDAPHHRRRIAMCSCACPTRVASHCPARVTSPYLRDLLFFFKRECQMLSELVIGSSCLRRWPLPTSRIGLSLPDSSAIAIGGGTCLRLNLQYQRVLRHHRCFKIERWPSRTMSCRACCRNQPQGMRRDSCATPRRCAGS